jgi:hypothetical protein
MSKWVINSLVVHPKFDTGAAENLWSAACGTRAALWPPLLYNNLNVFYDFSEFDLTHIVRIMDIKYKLNLGNNVF